MCSKYFNHHYGRTGTLWEGRHKASLVDAERYLLTLYRYIELNPVRAGMVRAAKDYRWSSYRCNALGWDDPVITPHALYLWRPTPTTASAVRHTGRCSGCTWTRRTSRASAA
jgi:hypothetical protein